MMRMTFKTAEECLKARDIALTYMEGDVYWKAAQFARRLPRFLDTVIPDGVTLEITWNPNGFEALTQQEAERTCAVTIAHYAVGSVNNCTLEYIAP